MRSLTRTCCGLILLSLFVFSGTHATGQTAAADASRPGTRVLLDAHNCYPYGDWWADRIDRAISTSTPLAIEQDLAWYTDSRSGRSWSVLSHTAAATGSEPTMKDYFFARIRPIVEEALRKGDRTKWPLITLNLDLKTEERAHLQAIRTLLGEYRDWITTAPRSADIRSIALLDVRPILVLAGESDAQKQVFYDDVPEGARLLVFGATRTHDENPSAPPLTLAPDPPDNYHRWWNNPWRVVEPEGQNAAGDWSLQDETRLNELVHYAHERGFWIRFYTLDGESSADESSHGWFHTYNFGSIDAARVRWQAAIRAGVDFVAVDQYEDFANELHGASGKPLATPIQGSVNRADYKRLFERDFDVRPGIQRLKVTLTYKPGDWFSVILRDDNGPTLFSNAIYLAKQ